MWRMILKVNINNLTFKVNENMIHRIAAVDDKNSTI